MKGFVVYPTYRVIDGKAIVYLFGRLENGESFLTKNYFRPYFFIKSKDLKKALKVKEFDHEGVKLKNFKGEEVTKIILDIPKDVPDYRKAFEEKDIDCYEADIRFSQRFLMDKGITGSLEIKGKSEKGELVVYANTIKRTEQDVSGDDVDVDIPFMKGYSAFNVEQIDGLPSHYYPLAAHRQCPLIIWVACSRMVLPRPPRRRPLF